MTKRIIALLLALIMVFSLASCSSDSDNDDDDDEKIEEKDEKDEDDDDEDEIDLDVDDDEDDEDDKDEVATPDDYEERYANATFEDGMAVDPIYFENNITIVPRNHGPRENSTFNQIELLITNNGSSIINFTVKEIHLNGVRVYCAYNPTTVHPGYSKELYAYYDANAISALKLDYIKEIKITLSYTTEADTEKEIVVDADSILFERPENYSDTHYRGTQTILDRKGIYCAPTQLINFSTETSYVYLYLENDNDFKIAVAIDSVTVNGEKVKATNYGTFTMNANSKNVFYVSLSGDGLASKITSNTKVEISFTVYNADATSTSDRILFSRANDGKFVIKGAEDNDSSNTGSNSGSNSNSGTNTQNPSTSTSFVGKWEHKKTTAESFYMEMNLNSDGTGDLGSSRSKLTWKKVSDDKIKVTLIFTDGSTEDTYATIQSNGALRWDYEFRVGSYGDVTSVTFTKAGSVSSSGSNSGSNSGSSSNSNSGSNSGTTTQKPTTNTSFVGNWEHKKTKAENFEFVMNLYADGTGDNGGKRSNLKWKKISETKIEVTINSLDGKNVSSYAYMQSDGSLLWDFECEIGSYGHVDNITFTKK